MDARMHDLPGLRREQPVATNATLLRALCDASLAPSPRPRPPAMDLALSANFGSAERWQQEFAAMGMALGEGGGWLLLSFQPRAGRLVNQWAADHDHALAHAHAHDHPLAGAIPVLALDRCGPASHPDAGASVDARMQRIDWDRVHERYQQAVTASSTGLGVTADDVAGATLLDVRRAGVFAASDALAEGAAWRDPAQVEAWATEFAGPARVVVYCVHGHEVSRATAMRLRAAGVDARFLVGGFDGWRSQGRPVVATSGG